MIRCLPSYRSSDFSTRLHPPSQISPHSSSPTTDIADPSPIATSSNGTDGTDIDDTGIESEDSETQDSDHSGTNNRDPGDGPTPRWSVRLTPAGKGGLQLETKNAGEQARKPRSDEDEQPSSVIHAPQGFDAFVSADLEVEDVH